MLCKSAVHVRKADSMCTVGTHAKLLHENAQQHTGCHAEPQNIKNLMSST